MGCMSSKPQQNSDPKSEGRSDKGRESKVNPDPKKTRKSVSKDKSSEPDKKPDIKKKKSAEKKKPEDAKPKGGSKEGKAEKAEKPKSAKDAPAKSETVVEKKTEKPAKPVKKYTPKEKLHKFKDPEPKEPEVKDVEVKPTKEKEPKRVVEPKKPTVVKFNPFDEMPIKQSKNMPAKSWWEIDDPGASNSMDSLGITDDSSKGPSLNDSGRSVEDGGRGFGGGFGAPEIKPEPDMGSKMPSFRKTGSSENIEEVGFVAKKPERAEDTSQDIPIKPMGGNPFEEKGFPFGKKEPEADPFLNDTGPKAAGGFNDMNESTPPPAVPKEEPTTPPVESPVTPKAPFQGTTEVNQQANGLPEQQASQFQQPNPMGQPPFQQMMNQQNPQFQNPMQMQQQPNGMPEQQVSQFQQPNPMGQQPFQQMMNQQFNGMPQQTSQFQNPMQMGQPQFQHMMNQQMPQFQNPMQMLQYFNQMQQQASQFQQPNPMGQQPFNTMMNQQFNGMPQQQPNPMGQPPFQQMMPQQASQFQNPMQMQQPFNSQIPGNPPPQNDTGPKPPSEGEAPPEETQPPAGATPRPKFGARPFLKRGAMLNKRPLAAAVKQPEELIAAALGKIEVLAESKFNEHTKLQKELIDLMAKNPGIMTKVDTEIIMKGANKILELAVMPRPALARSSLICLGHLFEHAGSIMDPLVVEVMRACSKKGASSAPEFLTSASGFCLTKICKVASEAKAAVQLVALYKQNKAFELSSLNAMVVLIDKMGPNVVRLKNLDQVILIALKGLENGGLPSRTASRHILGMIEEHADLDRYLNICKATEIQKMTVKSTLKKYDEESKDQFVEQLLAPVEI